MSDKRIILRYSANRQFYDTADKCHVTLTDLAFLIPYTDFKVVCRESNADITAKILKKIQTKLGRGTIKIPHINEAITYISTKQRSC